MVQTTDLKALTIKTARIAITTGKWMRAQQVNFSQDSVEVKAHNSLVSYVDQQAEKQIIEGLLELLPEAAILGEEGGAQASESPYKWIIDPLDGTTNFIHGLPNFAVSIALEHAGSLLLGVVYEVALDECFYAWKSGGAYLNGKRIYCTPITDLQVSLLATGFPYANFDKMEAYMNIFKDYMAQTRGLRRLGSAATDLAYVACGRFDGFFEYGLAPWDVAAGALLVQEAGGKVSDFAGADNYVYGQEIVASSSGIFDGLMKPIQKHWPEKS